MSKTIRWYLFVSFFVVVNSVFFAQQNVFTSELVQKDSSEFYFETILTSDSTIVVLNSFKKELNKLHFIQIDTNASILRNTIIALPCDEIIGGFESNNSIQIAGVYFDSVKHEDQLLVFSLHNDGSITNSLLLMKQQPNGGYHAEFKIAQSPDKSKFVALAEHAYKNEQREMILIKTYNDRFEEINSNDFTYSFPSLKRKINIPLINNNGNVYILKRIRINKKNIYYLVNQSSSGAITHDAIKLRNKPIADMTFLLDEEGALVLSGFFSPIVQFTFEGTYIKKYKESIDPVFSKEFMLPSHVVDAFKSKKDVSKFGFGLDKFHCKTLIENKEEYCLTAEHYNMENDNGNKVEIREGIVVVGFSKKGDPKFASPILTHQKDEDHHGYFNSIFSYMDQDYHIWFNEIGFNDKKADNNFDSNTFLGTRQATVTQSGEVKISALSNTIESDHSTALVIKSAMYLLNRIVILSEDNQRTKMHIVVIENRPVKN